MADLNERPLHHVPAASRGSARRRRIEGGRRREVKIRFTDSEYDEVAARAADARVSVQRYLTDGALDRVPAVNAAAVAELAGLRRLTMSLANNINQIARCLNSGGRPDPSIGAAADAVRRATQKLDIALAWAGVPPPPRRPAPVQEPEDVPRPTDPSAIRSAPPDDPVT